MFAYAKGLISFWLQVLILAFKDGFGKANTFFSILALAVFLSLMYLGINHTTDTDIMITTVIFISVFIIIFLVNLIKAPYTLYCLERDNAARLEQEIKKRNDKTALKNTIGVFINECRELYQKCADEAQPPPQSDCQRWFNGLTNFLLNNPEFGSSYIARLQSIAGILPASFTEMQSKEHIDLRWSLLVYETRLNEFLQEIR